MCPRSSPLARPGEIGLATLEIAETERANGWTDHKHPTSSKQCVMGVTGLLQVQQRLTKKKTQPEKKKHLYLKYTNQVVLYIYIYNYIYIYTIIYNIYIYHYKSYFSPRWSPPVSALPASKSVYPAMVTSTDSSMPQGVFPNDLAPWGIFQVWRNHDEPMEISRFLEKLWWTTSGFISMEISGETMMNIANELHLDHFRFMYQMIL